MAHKFLSYKETEKVKKAIAGMSANEFNRYMESVYKSGFYDALEQTGLGDSESYIWDEEQVYRILRRNYIAPELCRKIIAELEDKKQ